MTPSDLTPTPGTGHHRGWHIGNRTARRADRRRRNLRIAAGVVAGVVVCAAGVVGALVFLGNDDSPAALPIAKRATSTTTPLASTAVTTTPARLCRSPLTVDAPLRLWIAGDSLAYSVGNGLGKRAAATGVIAPVYESRVSSGLSSPGFFDWPRRVSEELPRLNPEIVVFVMGTNDWMVPQPTPVDATGVPSWKTTYAKQVQTMVDALTAGGRTLFWVGPPVLRDVKQEAGAKAVAAVIEDVVSKSPSAVFVDAHDLLDGDDGTYSTVIDVDGKKVTVRAGDGVHLTPDGGDYLGDAIFDKIDAHCRIKAQTVPGQRQQVVETKGSTSVAPGSTATAPPVAATTPPTVAATAPPVATTGPPAATTQPTVSPTSPTTLPPPPTATVGTTPTLPPKPQAATPE